MCFWNFDEWVYRKKHYGINNGSVKKTLMGIALLSH